MVRGIQKLIPVVLALMAGCADLPESYGEPPPVEPGARSPLTRSSSRISVEKEPCLFEPGAVMKLLEQAPALRVEREKIARESGAIIQGSYMPNPVLTLETEMMPVDDMGFGNARNKVRVAQRIETAGKADARVNMAAARQKAAEAAYFEARADLAAEAMKLFHDAAHARARAESNRRTEDLRKRLLSIAEEMNREGRLPQQDLIDYQIAAAKATDLFHRHLAEEKKNIADLEGILGLPAGTILECRGQSARWEPPSWKEASATILTRNPELIRLDGEIEAARAKLRLEESGAWTDITLGLGYSRAQVGAAGRDDFVGAFVQIPLPLIDRNQGAILSAEADIRGAEASLERVASRALDQWYGGRERWKSLEKSRVLYESSIIPSLAEQLALVENLVDTGRAPLTESLNIALELEGAREALIELNRLLDGIRVEMTRLAGGPQI